ncbi:hypothetical protein KC19_8G143000 [Ceratodon purpureus]|uniref:Alpha-type protein kinase domain-containing protein n=1 Tax=Ceratodon purpureus TaxID=3225 RepID=A0A8T0GYU9_CERPU|nr:hypothetical protein KC19_8G143000 [Ceratodon purpureus]
MDRIGEGSREGSVGSSSSGQSWETLLLTEQVEQLRREIELLKATITRTHVAPYPDHSTRTHQIQMGQLSPERERLPDSRLAPSGSAVSPRTYQDVNRSMPQSGAPQPDFYAYRNDQYQVPVSPEGMTSSHKYVIEAPFATKTVSSSKTSRSLSLPKPSAPPGASTRNHLAHSRSIQVDKDESSLRRDNWTSPGSYMPPSSPGLSPRVVPDFGEQNKSMSPQTLQSLGRLHMLRQDKEKLEAELSSRTRAQVKNNPVSAGSDMSLRSRKALDEAARVKREIDMLNASKAEIPAMSERTRQVMDQLERVRLENEILRSSKAKEMESARRRLAYFEQNHAAASRARMLEIRKMIITSQELDLAFLVDATGSMQTSIDMIKTTVTTMAAGIMASYPECKLRVAFVPYRDYVDAEQDDSELCDFTTNFYGPDSDFSLALSRVHAAGGGDDAEDVFSGIARVAQLSWDATNRLVFHIADAPCHGLKFHELGVGDFYPHGDIYDRTIEDQLRILYEVCHVSTYFFCHLNATTRKMIRVFQAAAAGSPLTILEEQFQNISSIPHKVITLCRGTIQQTLNVVNAQHPLDTQFVHEAVVKGVPSWSQVPVQFGVHFRCKWYRALDDMLSRINNKMALEEEAMDHIQVQIAKHPFSDEGAVRWPYYASITYPNERPRSMVVKRFKTPLGKDVREVHKRERYWAQMEVQSVSAHMANEFNNITLNMKNVKKVEFTQVTTLEVGSGPNVKYFNMESLLEGEWLRYSNNGGYVNTLDYAAVLQAFTHWTHERSRGLLMVTDLQGVRMMNSFGENVFCLCDPAIHCTDVLRFTRTNLGSEGFKLFFDTHKCNDVCEKLGLAVGRAGRTLSGTQVGSYW